MSDTPDLVLLRLDELRREVHELRTEVAACRRGRRTAWLSALCLALLTTAALVAWLPASAALAQRPGDDRGSPNPKKDAAPQAGQGQNLVVQSLKIVGADGKERLTIGYDDISGYVKIHGPDGKVRAALWTDDKSKYGQLTLFDGDNKMRVSLGGNELGAGCNLYSKDGKRHAYVGTASDLNGGILSLFDPEDKVMVHLGHDTEGGRLLINSHDAKARATLWVAKGGKNGLLQLHNEEGKTRAMLGADENGGFLDLSGTNDKRQVGLDCHSQWGGALNLYSTQDKKLMYLGANTTNGHGLFQLHSGAGGARIEMMVDNEGIGAVYGINGSNQTVRSLK